MMKLDVGDGLFRRARGLISVVSRVRKVPSDAETEALLALLPRETAHNMAAFLAPHVRSAGLAFLQALATWVEAADRAHERGQKVVLVPFNFPPDLVLAFDRAVPLTSEVLTTLASVALEGGGQRYWDVVMSLGLPDHVCSSNSIEIGSVLSGADLVPDAIISAAPGGCDANSKIHELLAQELGIPQLVLEKPVDDSPEGHELYGTSFRALLTRMEDMLGEELTDDKLRRLLGRANRCTELYWEIYELRKARPSPVPNIFSLFLAAVRFCLWGTEPGVAVLEELLRLASERYARGAYEAPEERARLLWAYTSYYFDIVGLHAWMEQRGYTFLGDVLDLYAPSPIDLTSRETMIDGMVQAAWDYPMNRQMATPSMSRAWTRDVVHVTRELGADCVVYSGHDACKQTWSVQSILGEELERQAATPLLALHGDSWMKTSTPMTALQAEIDELVANVVEPRRRGGARRRLRRRRRPGETGRRGG